jgi:hypothetical protein
MELVQQVRYSPFSHPATPIEFEMVLPDNFLPWMSLGRHRGVMQFFPEHPRVPCRCGVVEKAIFSNRFGEKKPVALKVCDQSQTRFQKDNVEMETAAMARLQPAGLMFEPVCPHIPAWDAMKDNHNFYIATDLGDSDLLTWGMQLSQKLGQHREVWRWEEVSNFVLRQVLNGVGFMHSRGVCHLDLDLRNVVMVRQTLVSTSDTWLVKLVDFGSSRLVSSDGSVSWDGCVKFKRNFCAPEFIQAVFDGQSFDGQRADTWSCGALYYQLLMLPYVSPARLEECFDSEGLWLHNLMAHAVGAGITLAPREQSLVATQAHSPGNCFLCLRRVDMSSRALRVLSALLCLRPELRPSPVDAIRLLDFPLSPPLPVPQLKQRHSFRPNQVIQQRVMDGFCGVNGAPCGVEGAADGGEPMDGLVIDKLDMRQQHCSDSVTLEMEGHEDSLKGGVTPTGQGEGVSRWRGVVGEPLVTVSLTQPGSVVVTTVPSPTMKEGAYNIAVTVSVTPRRAPGPDTGGFEVGSPVSTTEIFGGRPLEIGNSKRSVKPIPCSTVVHGVVSASLGCVSGPLYDEVSYSTDEVAGAPSWERNMRVPSAWR